MLPLRETVHFRRLREFIISCLTQENVNHNKYNLNNIRCYRIQGLDLFGKNVSMSRDFMRNPKPGGFLQPNKTYEIYEIAPIDQTGPFGEFIMFIKLEGTTYFEVVNVSVLKHKKTIHKVIYDKFYNIYDLIHDKDGVRAQRDSSFAQDFYYLFDTKNSLFDGSGNRRFEGYGLNKTQIKALAGVESKNINSKSKVKIYKKSKV